MKNKGRHGRPVVTAYFMHEVLPAGRASATSILDEREVATETTQEGGGCRRAMEIVSKRRDME
eukprot:6196672-Pleurochrysis_carterae.AAC.1